MIKLKDLNCKIPKNFCLIEAIDDSSILSVGKVNITLGNAFDGRKFEEGLNSVRRGYLIKLPTKIDHSEKGCPWFNDTKPIVGNIVYFDYLIGLKCEKATFENKTYYILPIRSLLMQLDSEMVSNTTQMLNGFILAQKLTKAPISKFDVTTKEYDDRYVIKKVGTCNYNYLDSDVLDDDEIVEGSVVLTKYSNYPTLEAKYQNRFDGQEYYYFQRNAVIALI